MVYIPAPGGTGHGQRELQAHMQPIELNTVIYFVYDTL